MLSLDGEQLFTYAMIHDYPSILRKDRHVLSCAQANAVTYRNYAIGWFYDYVPTDYSSYHYSAGRV